MGHCAAALLFGSLALPAIRLDGHAAAVHSEPSTLAAVAIDQGGHASRAVAFDRAGALVASASTPIAAKSGSAETANPGRQSEPSAMAPLLPTRTRSSRPLPTDRSTC